ncbi:MAG: hypothetical protein HY331_11530 [Chloroflexi bacterium]|nr:hypothetical protein [Chloroflexota bacterium]
MSALVALAALAVDVGAHFANRSYLETMADAAALAGAQVLAETSNASTAEQTALNYVITNTTKAVVPQPPLATAGTPVYDGGGTTPDHLVWGIQADATTGAVWVAVTNTIRFSFARILGFEITPAMARGMAYTTGGATRLTSWKPLATVTATPCLVSVSVSVLISNEGYWYTFDTSAAGTIAAQWTIPERNNINLSIYAGNPFAGQPNPVAMNPPGGDVASDNGSVTSLSVTAAGQPAGQYTVYFYDRGKAFSATSDGALTFMKLTCP